MASPVVKLFFTDGTSEVVTLNPRVMVETERKFGTIPPIEGTLYACWLRLGRKGAFDEFLDTVEDLDQSNGDGARPTEPEPSDGS